MGLGDPWADSYLQHQVYAVDCVMSGPNIPGSLITLTRRVYPEATYRS